MGCMKSTEKGVEPENTTTVVKSTNADFKVLILGNFGTGKTSLMLRFTRDEFSEVTSATIKPEVNSKVVDIEGKSRKLNIWDTQGQERLMTITRGNYHGSNIIIIVFSLSDKDTFSSVKNWILEVDRYAPEDVVKVLVGTKSDLETQVSAEEIETLLEDKELKLCGYHETSAKTGKGVEELFNYAAKVALRKLGSEVEDEEQED
eukprot:TRINITY_DN885_c0_g1_i2.p1 TRINITY_DN885_c0_g1~~TRINITY_DN885_c0_g1_i2.p1  ORF type:complete len:204 (+),score=37.60 TRINITY_DN885_c0_g1_i2:83-694(+)